MNLPPWLAALLWPLSLVYGAVARRRIRRYLSGAIQRKRLEGVVISVGNLTVGGTGKTPFVLWLAEKLHGEGKSIGILSRGYRGGVRTNRPPLAADGTPINLVGDEPQLMRHRLDNHVKIGVGADRWAHGRALEKAGVGWFVLDDAFQHLHLARDLDILLVDSTDRLESEFLLPAGRLREPLAGLARADIVVITRAESAPATEALIRSFSKAPIYYATTQLRRVSPSPARETAADPAEWLGKRVLCFCAIGNPGAFFQDLKRWGFDVAGHAVFRDHHRYTKSEVAKIERQATSVEALALVCTEKDARNLGALQFRKLPLFVCEISMVPVDEAGFLRDLRGIIERKRAGRAP